MGFVTKEKFLSKDFFITYAWLLGGCFVFALGAVMFAEPYGFAPGGTYGLSMVFHHLRLKLQPCVWTFLYSCWEFTFWEVCSG